MSVLFLENHDSFSWNVIDRLPFERADVRVVSSPGEALSLLSGFDALVIGPGPRDPERAGLIDVVRGAAARRLPTLGVCLGHQAIGVAFGARLIRRAPAHGIQATVEFQPSRLLPGLLGPVRVMRYHSLSLDAVVAPLRVVAATADGIPMAIEHESLPLAGVQFHPDSFGTPRGEELLHRFFVATGVA